MTCEFLHGSTCMVTSDLAGVDVAVTPSICAVCLHGPDPKSTNLATIGAALRCSATPVSRRASLLEAQREAYLKSLSASGTQGVRATEQYAEGVGTELKKILSWFHQLADESCKCTARAIVMNREGIDWCSQNREIIVGWLMEEYDERNLGLIDFVPLRMARLLRRSIEFMDKDDQRVVAQRGAGLALSLAIRRARKAQRGPK